MHLDHAEPGASLASNLASMDLHNTHSVATASSHLYEQREVPGKGIGTFAIAPIAAGARVISEAPLFAIHEDADILEVYRTVKALSDKDSSRFWALAASTRPMRDPKWIEELQSSYEDTSISFERLMDQHQDAMSRYETNRFTIRSLDGRTDTVGVFVEAARVNHSCAPNVFHRFNANISRITMHALRDIKPGEEILTSYIDICQPTSQRRRIMYHWGFKCKCEVCCAHDVDQDWRRKRLEELLASIRETEYDRAEQSWSQWDYGRALRVVEEAMALMEEEGMYESDTLGEVYAHAARYAAAIVEAEWKVNAVRWANNAAEIERKCCGEDSVEYAKATDLINSLHSNLIKTLL